MKSRSRIIPASLVDRAEDLVKRIDFARTTSSSLHVDVIDGKFCPGEAIDISKWPLIDLEYVEAHLMVAEPLDYLSILKSKGVTRAIVHVESEFDVEELATEARVNDILLGFAVNPDTDLTSLRKYFTHSSYIMIMGVKPGYVGQEQLVQTGLAVSYLKKLPYRLIISVDGGVTSENIANLSQNGADYFVCSSALYHNGDWQENYQKLSDLIK